MLQERFDIEIASLVGEKLPGAKILLAVSGGIDSMCMADLFLHSEMTPNIGIAHVNFQLRKTDCFLDQQMVADWAGRNNIPFYTTTFETYKYSKEQNISTQMAARDLRYGWFNEIMLEHGYDYLAVAHNANDSVETLFLNLLRGTGVRGITGIKQINGKIIRPLLSCTREEIEKYVETEQVLYRDDVTNFESHYARNRVRNIIFPELKKINPSYIDTIYRNIQNFTDADDILNDLFVSKKGTLYNYENDGVVIDIAALKREKGICYWLYRIIGEYGFNYSQVSALERSLDSQSGKEFHSEKYNLLIDRGKIKVYPLSDIEDTHAPIMIEKPGLYLYNGREFKVDLFVKPEKFKPVTREGQLFMDAAKVRFPIVCRSWERADKFQPFGLKGAKKLSDFFTDLKMDKYAKSRQIILTNIKDDNEEIICLPGLRIDDRYKITKNTAIIIEIVLI